MAAAPEPKTIEDKVIEDDTLSMETVSLGNESNVSKAASDEWVENEDKIPISYYTAPRSKLMWTLSADERNAVYAFFQNHNPEDFNTLTVHEFQTRFLEHLVDADIGAIDRTYDLDFFRELFVDQVTRRRNASDDKQQRPLSERVHLFTQAEEEDHRVSIRSPVNPQPLSTSDEEDSKALTVEENLQKLHSMLRIYTGDSDLIRALVFWRNNLIAMAIKSDAPYNTILNYEQVLIQLETCAKDMGPTDIKFRMDALMEGGSFEYFRAVLDTSYEGIHHKEDQYGEVQNLQKCMTQLKHENSTLIETLEVSKDRNAELHNKITAISNMEEQFTTSIRTLQKKCDLQKRTIV